MAVGYNPSIVSDGLVFFLDPANKRSYSGSGLTTNGLVGGIGGALVNGVGFTSSNNGSFFFDGSNDYISEPNNSIFNFASGFLTISVWVNFSSVSGQRSIITNYQSDMDQILSNFVPYSNPYIVICWKIPEEFGIKEQEFSEFFKYEPIYTLAQFGKILYGDLSQILTLK
jgi:hypothetical protein